MAGWVGNGLRSQRRRPLDDSDVCPPHRRSSISTPTHRPYDGLRVRVGILVVVVGVSVFVGTMTVIVVVHQLFGDVGKHLARGQRRATGPFDAALLARR